MWGLGQQKPEVNEGNIVWNIELKFVQQSLEPVLLVSIVSADMDRTGLSLIYPPLDQIHMLRLG